MTGKMTLPIWMNPLVIMAFWFVVACASLASPRDIYFYMMGSPKYVTIYHLAIIGVSIGCFVAGSLIGAYSVSGRPAERAFVLDKLRTIFAAPTFRRMYLVFFGLTFLAYAIFLGPTLNPDVLIRFFTQTTGYVHGKAYGNPISGVTTMTQFGVALAAFSGYALALLPKGPVRRFYAWGLFIVILMATYRSFVWGERLAMIECAVAASVAYIIASYRGQKIYQILPLFGLVTVIFFFGITEYYRSFSFYSQFGVSLPAFATTRFLSYYLSAFNNMALSIDYFEPVGSPVNTLHFLFKFPLFSGLRELNSQTWTDFMLLFERYSNPEFNLFSAVGLPINEFGIEYGLFVQLILGLITGRIYRLTQLGRLWGLMLFPVWMVGMAEFGRLMYWTASRATPVWLLLFIAVYLGKIVLDKQEQARRQQAMAVGSGPSGALPAE